MPSPPPPISLMELLDACAARGVALEAGASGTLRVRAPAGSLSEGLQAEIRFRKADLIALLAGASAQPITPVERSAPLVLSSAQARLFFLTQLDPKSSAAYNIVVVVRIRGPLRPEILKLSLDSLAKRHESLRTGFVASGGRAEQRISPEVDIPFSQEDLSGTGDGDREKRVCSLVESECRTPFDLAAPPLLRAALVTLAPGETLFILAIHHLVSDGWSSGVIIRDLSELYEAHIASRPARLPPLPVQYADYAAWQARELGSPRAAASLAHWVEALRGVPILNLPTDRPRPVAMSFRGGTAFFTYPPALARELRDLARREEATLFHVLLSGFFALMSRYSGQDDFAVGTSVANRSHPSLEPLIGFLTNTLALRSRIDGRAQFRSLVRATKAAVEAAHEHADTPLERVIEALRPERTMSQNPLFQVCFSLLQAHRDTLRVSGLELEQLNVESPTSRFDLTVTCEDAREGLIVSFEYSSDLFDRATIERMAGHLRILLEAAVADPATPVRALPLMDAHERSAILFDWNRTSTPYPASQCVHELFEEWAGRTPGATAVEAPGCALTYGELNAAANRLALRLAAQGVCRDQAVAVCAERSAEMVVALLAVLKAGGCYLPFDPADPPERLAFYFEQAGARIMLSPREARGRLPRVAGVEWMEVRLGDPGADPGNPGPGPGPDNLAYITFTSGSTGRPKGICIPHRGVTRLVRETNYVDYGPQLRILELAPVSFDASTFELWGALCNGAVLVVFRAGPPTIGDLAAAIQGGRITSLYLTSALFNLMVDERPDAFQGVSHLIVGGDSISPPHVERILGSTPGLTVINGYGPTETTTFASCGMLRRPSDVGHNVTIGPPMSNTTLYILDAQLEPVPVGVPGSLYIGGDGNARGYLSAPALTAENFVPNPHSPVPGARIYRTGDLARWRPDGTAEFLGREDLQVKLRGFRVEPGEIEGALAGHPGVQAAVVLVQEDRSGKSLVACIQSLPGRVAPSPDELRAHLRSRLPEFMVPARFAYATAFPLTAHNKVDRQALRVLAVGAVPQAPAHVPPRGPVEEALAGHWAEVLKVDRVGAADNFFELGGHSLLVTQLLWRVSETFGVDLPLRTLFDAPVLGDFASALTRAADAVAPGRSEAIARLHLRVASLPAGEAGRLLRERRPRDAQVQ